MASVCDLSLSAFEKGDKLDHRSLESGVARGFLKRCQALVSYVNVNVVDSEAKIVGMRF